MNTPSINSKVDTKDNLLHTFKTHPQTNSIACFKYSYHSERIDETWEMSLFKVLPQFHYCTSIHWGQHNSL